MFPSIEDVAMWIALDGMLGTNCFWPFPVGEDCVRYRAGDSCRSDVGLLFGSPRVAGSGGGNGEIEMEETEAECGWYTRSTWNDGSTSTFYEQSEIQDAFD